MGKIIEEWDFKGNPMLGGRNLVYIPPQKMRDGKTHLVKVVYGPGEQDFPDVFRFATVGEARECWKSQRSRMERDGLVKRAA